MNNKNPLRHSKKATEQHPNHKKETSVACYHCQNKICKENHEMLMCTNCKLYCLAVSTNQEFSSYYCTACLTHWKITENW